jgi:hypothetical protein
VYILVNILNIRKCKVLIGVKLILLDFILLIIKKGRNNFTKLYTVLLPPPSCHSCTNDHADNPILHYISNFRGQCVCLVAMQSDGVSRQASGRNELLQFADRCNKLLVLSLGTSPSPLPPDIPRPHIFFMTSGTA